MQCGYTYVSYVVIANVFDELRQITQVCAYRCIFYTTLYNWLWRHLQHPCLFAFMQLTHFRYLVFKVILHDATHVFTFARTWSVPLEILNSLLRNTYILLVGRKNRLCQLPLQLTSYCMHWKHIAWANVNKWWNAQVYTLAAYFRMSHISRFALYMK